MPAALLQPSIDLRPGQSLTVASPHVTVGIINYCQWRHVGQLLNQLGACEDAELLVLDNASPPPDEKILIDIEPTNATIYQSSVNGGYAWAANQIIQRSNSNWVLLLNPDTEVTPGFIDSLVQLCKELESESNIGIVGLQLRDFDGKVQPSTGNFPTLGSLIARMVLPRHLRKGNRISSGNRTPTNWVSGCGMLIRKECWQSVGGCDDRFFLYYEDTDFCKRASEHGWDICYEPGLAVYHLKPLHRRPVPPPLRLIVRHGLIRYASKHWCVISFWMLLAIIWAESTVRYVRASLKFQPLAGYFRLMGKLTNLFFVGDQLQIEQVIKKSSLELAQCPGREDC